MNSMRRGASKVLSFCLDAQTSKLSSTLGLSRNFGSLSKCVPKLSNQNVYSVGQVRRMQTQGDKEIVDFLTKEIAEEKQGIMAQVPKKFLDFDVAPEGAYLTFKKKFNNEIVSISLDVNHTVDAEQAGAEDVELKSRPAFEVDVVKGNKTLSFTCSYMEGNEESQDDAVKDIFGINEITIFEGEGSEKDYCVSGDIVDENLYDMFMTFLEERGIDDKFAEELCEFCSSYEHRMYVNLLQEVQDFLKK